jgi:predicted MFS family arabinose efflux permease
MSLNTMAYNTSIALGALFGGLVADGLGVSGVIWFGLGLTVSALVVMAVFGSMVKTVRDGEGRYSDGSALSEAA